MVRLPGAGALIENLKRKQGEQQDERQQTQGLEAMDSMGVRKMHDTSVRAIGALELRGVNPGLGNCTPLVMIQQVLFAA
jgi:hypothetical protein